MFKRRAIKQHTLLRDAEYNYRPKVVKRKKEMYREKEFKEEIERWKKGDDNDNHS